MMDPEVPRGTLLLKKSEIGSLMALKDYIDGMEAAFKAYALGRALKPGLIHVDCGEHVEFHVKAGGVKLGDTMYFGLKANGASFLNKARYGLPNILGVILLFHGEMAFPLAIVDSVDITIMRTGATTAVAAKYLARPDSKVATICGCGNQGRVQLRALKEVLPIQRAFAFDVDVATATTYAKEMSGSLGMEVSVASDLKLAIGESDVVVTCTPSKKAYVMKEFVKPGTFIAGVGADSPDKQEIDAALLASSDKLVVDVLEQCAMVGELHHAIDAGLMTREDVHGDLGSVITGAVTARTSDEEIIVYDATGTALQDATAAAICYEKALKQGAGVFINLLE